LVPFFKKDCFLSSVTENIIAQVKPPDRERANARPLTGSLMTDTY
jgi:hypothetical protein